jgi:hypothetical protein
VQRRVDGALAAASGPAVGGWIRSKTDGKTLHSCLGVKTLNSFVRSKTLNSRRQSKRSRCARPPSRAVVVLQLAGLRMHTGSGLTGWQAAQYAHACSARCTPWYRRRHRDIWELHCRTMWLHVHSAPCAYVSEGCAACLESVAGQRAPKVPVANAVDCARLEIGLAVSIETRPELRGVSNAGGTQRSTTRRFESNFISCAPLEIRRGGGIEPTKDGWPHPPRGEKKRREG